MATSEIHAVNVPRLVLDTNVVMDLFHFAAPPLAPLMAAIDAGSIICLANHKTLAELQRVVGYPQFRLDAAGGQQILDRYRACITLVTQPAGQPLMPLPKCRDPDDQMFLELAQAGKANMLISRDNLVLKLANARQRPCPFAILSPEQAMQRLFAESSAMHHQA